MRIAVSLILLVLVIVNMPLIAQQQAQMDLPTYTLEQRWERASSQYMVRSVAGIAYAKAMGQSAEKYGEFCAELFAPGWGEPSSGSVSIIRGVRRNMLLWSGAEFKITESSKTSMTGRANRPWAKYFGEDHTWYGVTSDELETVLHVFNQRLANYLVLQYEDRIDGDWFYMTFSRNEAP